MEILAAHAAMAGGSRTEPLDCSRWECIATTAALELLEKEGILKEVMSTVMIRIRGTSEAPGRTRVLEIGAVMFSKEMGILGKTSDADRLAAEDSEAERRKYNG